MAILKAILAFCVLISAPTASAGICESIVTGIFATAHKLFDRTGQSYGFAKVISDIKRLAASTHYHEMPGSSGLVLDSMIKEFSESRSVTPEERAKFYEEVVKIFLAEAHKRAGAEFISNNVGYGQAAILEWLIQHAQESAKNPGIQKLFVDAIGKLQRTESLWTRIMLERVLLEVGANPAVGFEPLTLQLFDRIELRDQEHLTSGFAILSSSSHLRPILEKWLPRIEMEIMRESLVPALNEYNLKFELRAFSTWLNGHAHNGLGLEGPNGYYDQKSMTLAILNQSRENREFKNRLNGILHNVTHARILVGLHNSDRTAPMSEERREPRFVEPALRGALAIMSYMSQEKRLAEDELTERQALIAKIPLEVLSRLLKMAEELGTYDATEAFLQGNLSVDPLCQATVSFREVIENHFLDRGTAKCPVK